MWDELQIVRQVLDAGATIRVLDFPSLDLTTPEGRGFLALFSAMAERERMRIVERTQEGRRSATEAGERMGRKLKLTAHQQKSARVSLASGESSCDIAKDFAVQDATMARLRSRQSAIGVCSKHPNGGGSLKGEPMIIEVMLKRRCGRTVHNSAQQTSSRRTLSAQWVAYENASPDYCRRGRPGSKGYHSKGRPLRCGGSLSGFA
jgi:hypothetical protein